MLGQVLDRRYQITEILGKGGFGQTFLAEDRKRPGNPICVVKQLKPSFSDPDLLVKARELFNREAEILQKLGEHDRIPRLLAYFEEDNEFYLVQEYIKGKTLDRELISDETLTKEQVTTIIRELLEILDFVHAHQVIHRDLKPANIIRRERDNKLVLIDFGAVKKITTEGKQKTIVIGTPGYMPIEQLQGKPNFCSDLYAVGILGVVALTGQNPAMNFDPQASIVDLSPTKISPDFASILTKMVADRERDRYQSATTILKDIEKLNSKTIVKTVNKQPIVINFSILIFLAILTIFALFKIRNIDSFNNQLSLKGEAISGLIDSNSDCEELIGNFNCDRYNFKGKKGQKIVIEMNSDDFDPLLIILRSDGTKLAVNGDIEPDNWNAKIAIELSESGEYIAIARTSFAGESGSYSLKATIE